MLLEHALEQLGHRPERDLTVEESCYRDLVGRVDRARRGAPAPPGLERQVEGGMGAGLERRERERGQGARLERRGGRTPVLGPRQRQLDRQPHVGGRRLEHRRAVAERDQRMDPRFGMEHRLELVPTQIEQPARLDELEALVEEQRRIHGDARSHGPHRMREHLLARGAPPVGVAAQRPARGGEGQARDLRGRTPAQTLERGTVLAVHRHQLARARAGERTPHQRAAHDQRLLVGEREPRAALERGERGLEAGGADHAVEHDLGSAFGGEPGGRAGPDPHPRAGGGGFEARARLGRIRGALERERRGLEPRRLLAQRLETAPGRQGGDAQARGLGGRHLERLNADRAGRAQHREGPRARLVHGTWNTASLR